MSSKHIRLHLISSMTMLGIHYRLHSIWYWLVERLEVLGSDVVSNHLCNSFQPCFACCFPLFLQVFHLNLWVLNWIEHMARWSESIFGVVCQCTILHNLRKIFPTTLAKSKCFIHLALISKQVKIQEPAWSHLIDFLKMQILKKNHLFAIKIMRVMTL